MDEPKRQLAAILFSDIVSYSTIMEEDEEKALKLLSKNRTMQKEAIETHRGKWVKEIGDGILARFDTVFDAVNCALEIQKLSADISNLSLRIGIHEGEIIVQDDDVFGSGVNIASRIQSITPENKIWVSESVHNNLVNKKDITTKFIKEELLKNLNEAVRIYEVLQDRVRATGNSVVHPNGTVATRRQKLIFWFLAAILVITAVVLYRTMGDSGGVEEPLEKTIAVLPFKDLSEEGDQHHFADGVMEDILTQLQKMKDLSVKSRTSVEQYRDTQKNIVDIAEELDVNYVLEGSYRRSGDKVLITAQLIDATKGDHLWAENYPTEFSAQKIFEIQEVIARKIVNDLKVNISPEKFKEITEPTTSNTRAYEFFLLGREAYHQYNFESTMLSRNYLKKAIEEDPGFAMAYGILSNTYVFLYSTYAQSENYLDSAEVVGKKGLEISDNCDWCLKGLALVETEKYKDFESSIKYREKALGINPNNSSVANNLFFSYANVGQIEKALDLVSGILKNRDDKFTILARVFNLVGELQRASEYMAKYVESMPGGVSNSRDIVIIYHYTSSQFAVGNLERTIEGIERLIEISGSETWLHNKHIIKYWMEEEFEEVVNYYESNLVRIKDIRDQRPYRWNFQIQLVAHSYYVLGDTRNIDIVTKEMLRIIDEKGTQEPYSRALAYLFSGDIDLCLDWLEKAINVSYMKDISTDTFLEDLYEHPRFKELVLKQREKKKGVMELVASYNFPTPEELTKEQK